MANLDKLVQAGIVNQDKITDQDKQMIEKLAPAEVDAIISAHGKLGTDSIKALHAKGAVCF